MVISLTSSSTARSATRMRPSVSRRRRMSSSRSSASTFTGPSWGRRVSHARRRASRTPRGRVPGRARCRARRPRSGPACTGLPVWRASASSSSDERVPPPKTRTGRSSVDRRKRCDHLCGRCGHRLDCAAGDRSPVGRIGEPGELGERGGHVGRCEEPRVERVADAARARSTRRAPGGRRGRGHPTGGGTPRPTTTRRRCAAGGRRRARRARCPARPRSAAADVSGSSCSRPTSSHVPVATNGASCSAPASTADAVSWPPTRCTGIPRQLPTCVPAGCRGASTDALDPDWRRRARPTTCRVARSSSPVVPADEGSAVTTPVRWWTRSSGSMRRWRARASCSRSCVASWKIVSIGSACSPVVVKKCSAPIRSSTDR